MLELQKHLWAYTKALYAQIKNFQSTATLALVCAPENVIDACFASITRHPEAYTVFRKANQDKLSSNSSSWANCDLKRASNVGRWTTPKAA